MSTPNPRFRPGWLSAAGLLMAALITMAVPAYAGGAEGEGWDSFNESDGCGAARARAPRHTSSGWLGSSTPIRGPWGDHFGRTIGAVHDALVWWSVPGSDGERLQIHERMFPAMSVVNDALVAHQSAGLSYPIYRTYTFAYNPRTIGDTTKLSGHAIGNAVDINSRWNPYSSDNVLRTNMPDWFVDTFRDAGFCWGGDWIDFKDAMHYTWQGPAFTAGVVPQPIYPPRSAPSAFGTVDVSISIPDPEAPGAIRLLAEGDGDAALDVIFISESGSDLSVDVSQARLEHSDCDMSHYEIPGESLDDATVLYGDYDGRGGMELWFMRDDGGTARFTVYDRWTDFENSVSFESSVPFDPTATYITGDYGGDGTVDLWVFRSVDGTTSLDVWSRASGFEETLLSIDTGLGDTTGARFTLGDRDLDRLPDIFAVDPSGSLRILPAASGYGTVAETLSIPELGVVVDVTAGDYDGDGRDDLQVLRADGQKLVLLGNNRIFSDLESWFVTPGHRCPADEAPNPYDGAFRDDDGNIHEANIDFIAELGTTRGCNPPANDRYCPERLITRGELAAFLTRTLGLTDIGGKDWFVDDDDSIFEGDINRLAAAGISKGCNPPANDRYCPDERLTRGQMAAFVARAFGLTETSGEDVFVDDNDSVFEHDIEALAFARVTLGCNPPANNRFCPDRAVPRDEMASFFARAVRHSRS
ncbi:MAG: M15 family metallopeptidase [Actinomycetota bacterium]|nr:M15 family metallopeptidase [Actinomycetota bacterium]